MAKERSSDYADVIEFAGILAFMREPFDSHGDKVAQRVSKMCVAMNVPKTDAQLIVVGAHLHDVGKLLTQSDLVNMNRKLTISEIADMQNHTNLGWEAVRRAGYHQIIQDIVHHHHEAWDGSGYPIGLQDELIPLAARIVGICDVYEALTARRPYRPAYSHEVAKSIMQTLRGTGFEPRLVDIFFEKVAIEQELEETVE